MFHIMSLDFYCDKELQELPLVHEVIFEKHMDRVHDTYRLKRLLCVFLVMTPHRWTGSLLEVICLKISCIAKLQ